MGQAMQVTFNDLIARKCALEHARTEAKRAGDRESYSRLCQQVRIVGRQIEHML